MLSRHQMLAMAACIEATIPFRERPGRRHCTRGCGRWASPEDDVAEMVRRAVRLSNSDVGNFADPDPARFLDNTWKLLPETNPALHMASTYTRARLPRGPAEDGGLPRAAAAPSACSTPGAASRRPRTHTRRVAAAALQHRRWRCATCAASCTHRAGGGVCRVESGGDVPLDLFMGGLPEAGGPVMKRIEQFLPKLPPADGVDPVLLQLLKGGRATPSSFDISPSPLASFLYAAQGEAKMMAGVATARRRGGRAATARGVPGEAAARQRRGAGRGRHAHRGHARRGAHRVGEAARQGRALTKGVRGLGRRAAAPSCGRCPARPRRHPAGGRARRASG